MKILLIGNSGHFSKSTDGQTIKVILYKKKIEDEGNELSFVDLDNFIYHPISILCKIKKQIKICDRIVLLAGERGCKILIPFINRHNKKYCKPFILPLIGISVLHYSIDKLSDKYKKDFLNGNYSLCKYNKKLSKDLSKITYILPETDLLSKVFREYYRINNVITLNNFRENVVIKTKPNKDSRELHILFLSRVMQIKGIFDILDVVQELIKEGYNIKFDIFGKLFLSEGDELLFNSFLSKNINYNGVMDFKNVIETISKYDLFVFPTRYTGEGTPGVLAESLIAGTPVLTSDFLQARFLLKDGADSVFYEMFNKVDLKNKLIYILNNKKILYEIRKGAVESGKRFTYKYVREIFLKYVCGIDEKKHEKSINYCIQRFK